MAQTCDKCEKKIGHGHSYRLLVVTSEHSFVRHESNTFDLCIKCFNILRQIDLGRLTLSAINDQPEPT